jgi:2-dehydropantoate 2-reductase
VSKEGAERIRTSLLDPGSGWMASMMRDIAKNARRIENGQIIGDLAVLARRHRIDTPLLDAADCHLQVYAAKTALKD